MEWHNLRTSYNLDLQLLKIHDSAIFDPIIISESRQKLLLSYYDPLAARYVEAVSYIPNSDPNWFYVHTQVQPQYRHLYHSL